MTVTRSSSNAAPGGVLVASVTPFRDDDRRTIDLDAYLAHVRWLAGHGVHGIVPFGTNGEGPSVAAREQRPVLEALVGAAGDLQVVPAVMEAALPDTLDQLEFLADLPVAAVLVLPPYYFKPVDPEGLRRFYERVLAATAHPVLVYHIPKYAVPVPAELVTSLPVWGAKDSGGEAGYAETLRAGGKGVLLGTEDDLPRRLLVAQGAISALANIVPEQVVALYDHVRARRRAETAALAEHLQRVRAMTKEHASVAVLKRVAQERHGHPMGGPRPPLLPLPDTFDAAAAVALTERAPVGS
jgi:4-hydroxy-tetrahydrodipicolinate synthase